MKNYRSKVLIALAATALGSMTLDALLGSFQAVMANSPGEYTRKKRTKAAEAPISVTYSVEVIHDGKVAKASDSYVFHKQDNVRFHVQSNTDGYMYILASGLESGEYDVLYPPYGVATSPLRKGQDYYVPEKGIELKSNNALKSLKLVFSKEPIPPPGREASPTKPVLSEFNDTISGTTSTARPASFAAESSTTLVIDKSWQKPLGAEIKLNGAVR